MKNTYIIYMYIFLRVPPPQKGKQWSPGCKPVPSGVKSRVVQRTPQVKMMIRTAAAHRRVLDPALICQSLSNIQGCLNF